MSEQRINRLNQLEKQLPEGLLVDSTWLTSHGFASNLRSHYVTTGWLEQPARQVYRRPRGTLSWQQIVISLQTLLLRNPLTVGGRTALELQGYAHFLKSSETEVHLYGPKHPPAWLNRLPLQVRFRYHNNQKLFRNEPVQFGTTSLAWDVAKNRLSEAGAEASFTVQPWGQWDWPLMLSTPERAVLELLDQLPKYETFNQVDMLFGGLSTLRPRRLQKLLSDCKSVKVKRLFFFFADRHHHAWLKHLDRKAFNLGKGKRLLAKGGKYDPIHQITVPEDMGGNL
jgi:Transcriptional regulator, AbiEi antitoxin, Type IV TA system/Transcriptional regulator, AbiEi antitoxin N-terminal domain